VAVSDIVSQYEDEHGQVYYKMKSHDIQVKASQNSGLAPVITYWMDDKDITDSIRKLRFSPRPPSSYIQDYEEFQAMLYSREQRAINQLYEQMSIKPKKHVRCKTSDMEFLCDYIGNAPSFHRHLVV